MVEISLTRGATVEVRRADPGTADGAFPHPWRCVHVVTAHNPGSRLLTEDDNARRNDRLRADIVALAATWRPALGRSEPPDPPWQEDSFALFDVARRDVLELARRHGQAAVYEWTLRHRAVVLCDPTGGEPDDGMLTTGWVAQIRRHPRRATRGLTG